MFFPFYESKRKTNPEAAQLPPFHHFTALAVKVLKPCKGMASLIATKPHFIIKIYMPDISFIFLPMLHNYTRESILIGSVFMQNYYQRPSKAVEERRDGKRNGFYINEPRIHLHMDEDC